MKTYHNRTDHSALSTTTSNDPAFKPIYVLYDFQLLNRFLYQEMAKFIAALEMSSREVPDWMAENIYFYEGKILWPAGSKFEIADDAIDMAFNDDASFRWIRSFRNHAEVPLKQRPQERLLFRLRLIALAIEIERRNAKPQGEKNSSPVRV